MPGSVQNGSEITLQMAPKTMLISKKSVASPVEGC